MSARASGSPGPQQIVVVTEVGDLPGFADGVVTANEFLTGGAAWARPRATVVNLSRSLRYLSKGYYVSLLAAARDQRALPGVDTLRQVAERHAMERQLEEAGVPCFDPSPDGKRAGRAGPGEEARAFAALGRALDPRFRRQCAAIYRTFPLPLLRATFRLQQKEWRVVDVEPTPVHLLAPEERALLVEELKAVHGAAPLSRRKSLDKRASLAVLFDGEDLFGPSTTETMEKLQRTAARKGLHVHLLAADEIARLGDYDALFIRALTGLNLPAFRWASRAEALDMPVIDDTQSIIRCSNKVFLHELLARKGIPTPKTLVASSQTSYESLVKALGTPFIVKLPDGSFSTAVHKVASKADWQQKARPMLERSPLIVAQAWTPTEFDWRVTTLGGKPLFVCKYHMAPGHWQVRNADPKAVRYGKVEAVPRAYAPQDVLRVGCRAARLVGDGLYGVDIKDTPKGPLVIEVNDNPNIDTGYDDAAEGNVIYEEIVDHFLARIEKARKPSEPTSRPARAPADPILAALRRPIGRAPRRGEAPVYRAFDVCGLELEYALVDRDLNVVSVADKALALLAGRPASDAALGAVEFSHEIMDHVLELKTPAPTKSLAHAEAWLAEGVRRLAALLSDRFDARLLPTGMHPWLDPRKARVWARSQQEIYGAYARIFDVQTHGWANVHACHVNLPLGRPDEAAALVNASALLVPYAVALAASTPMHDGELQSTVSSRMAHVLGHQARLPESMGAMVPEYVTSLTDYRRRVLRPMYAAAAKIPGSEPLRSEFLNARAAIVKFQRASLEVRCLDMQECVKMDVAVAAFVRWALADLTERLLAGSLELPPHAALVEDLHAAVKHGTRARVNAPHLAPKARRDRRGRAAMRDVLADLLARARKKARADEKPYLALLDGVLEKGNLSERIAAALEPHLKDDDGFTDAARRIYVELSESLTENVPWKGRG
jgi:glutathione synthase/RimK-type ligase-like ATP-grasp enzyme/gamma-glutamyl:cysteine ligase YbdK (ATP-grasp superfamily)